MKPIVGYLVDGKGERGQAYQYDMAAEGVYIEAENERMSARVLAAPGQIRGLKSSESSLVMRTPIPVSVFQQAYLFLLRECLTETFVAIVWKNNHYEVVRPSQLGTGASVKYETVPNTVVEIHTHGAMEAWFSEIDDHDEQGFKIYMVLGSLMTEFALRVGCYGAFAEVCWDAVFEGDPPFNLCQVEGIYD